MNVNALLIALSAVFTPYNVLVICGGTVLGIFIGAMPGMSSVMGLSILLPFTFQLHGYASIMMLLGIFCGSIYGGSISATLMNTPGTAASAATCLDAYPMAVLQRQPGRALSISTFSSLCGGLFSCVVLVFGSTMLAKVALNFKSPEYFALAFFGISIITGVSGKSVIKGLMGGILGLLFSTVGVDNFTGTYRFTFGSSFMKGGLSMVPILIGVFAFAQALKTIEEKYNEKPFTEKVVIERIFPVKEDLKRIWPTVLRSAILGTFIGSVPGTGGDIASWVGYNEAKRWSKHKEEFGHGSPEGIAGSEAANNAIAGGAFVPLLALGIPGDAGTAVMLGALTMMGIVSGPLLFVDSPEQAYTIFIGLFVANILMGVFGFCMIRVFGKVINIPNKYLVPVIVTFCITGTFALNRYLEEVFLMLIMGVIGYFLIKLDFSMPPIILGLVLGALAEKNARRSLDMFAGGDTIWQHPIAIVFVILGIISLASPAIGSAIKKMKAKRAAPPHKGEEFTMANDCMYCQADDERRLKLMTPIADLKVSTLHLYREQSYPGRCVLVYKNHTHKLTDLSPEQYNDFFQDVSKAAHALTDLYHPDKINYLVLGDLCPHLHIHLVPKYQGGTDWGTIFQMMPEPQHFLTEEEEAAEIRKIREKLVSQ